MNNRRTAKLLFFDLIKLLFFDLVLLTERTNRVMERRKSRLGVARIW